MKGERFFIRGVTYGTFAPNEEGEPFPAIQQVRDDFARMREAGITAIRTYTSPSDRIADAAYAAGLYIIPDICWGPRTCEWEYPEWWRKAVKETSLQARRLGKHPAILMLSVGNELPPLMVRWYGRKKTEGFLKTLCEAVKAEAPNSIVTYVNHPPTEYLHLPFLDVVSYNVYLERDAEFRAYLARLQNLSGEKPLFLAELGLDSRQHGQEEQARYLGRCLRATWEKGLCGAAIYSWTDEWSIFSSAITGWQFGLTTATREPKPALSAVRDVYSTTLCGLRKQDWPLVSVVVASYNGAATLDTCLHWLSRLHYPNYEVIVIDDGSTDGTVEILRRHGVRAIHVPNGGLSRARNLGIGAAKGEIVAFTDSDAHPDKDWLSYLVLSLREQNAAAVGGPNIAPKGDGFIAECVDCAPGNPTHVLLDDERAEHVPGCNMAYRKEALEEIGMFDVTHRSAGDDVDVCWKLLVRGYVIAFSPSAIVHHHRRSTVRAYLRQQRGYGFAEAHLQRRYPGRFNFFGHQVWRGHIYDNAHRGLREYGFPLLFRFRVYQGTFCDAQFQSIYRPFLTWWFQIFTTIEWQLITLAISATGLLAYWRGSRFAPVPLTLAGAMLLLMIGSALLCGIQSGRRKPWMGATQVRGILIVAALHLLQPLARAHGRLKGFWAERDAHWKYPTTQRLYGDLWQRAKLLEGLQEHFRACGWVSAPASEWEEHDLTVYGPGPYRLYISTVHEDDVAHNCHYVRYRITARMKVLTPIIFLLLLGALALTALRLWLLPLALPVILLLLKFIRARHAMLNGVAQLTAEYGEAIRMQKATDDF